MAKGDIKRRREIERLSASLPSLTSAQEWEAQQVKGVAWIGKRKGFCDVCGREFDTDLWDNPRKKHTECPKCGTRVEVKRSPNKRKESTRYYWHIITTAGDWQVVRTFYCHRNASRADWVGSELLNPSEAKLYMTEVFQKFIKPGVVPMNIGLGTRGMHYYSDQWKWDSKWIIRSNNYSAYSVWGWISKDHQLLPELKMKGLKRLSDESSPYDQIEKVMNDYRAEVMLKAGAVRLFDRFVGRDNYRVAGKWDSVRVALRHKYHTKVRDWGMWLDYVALLGENGKDVRNPHYICPASLKEAHQRELAIRERRLEKARLERDAKEAMRQAELLSNDGKTNKDYQQRMGDVLGVIVRGNGITLRPLQDIRDFFDEGSTLHHCVFSNGYYKHKNCLIIGARVNGRRTETIEVNTATWKVEQCRGKHNQPSIYHTKIMRLINSNMDKFRRATV